MIPDNPERGNWPRVEITSEGYDEGFGIGDIKGDGLLDISGRYGKDGKSLAWWQNPWERVRKLDETSRGNDARRDGPECYGGSER